MDDYISRAKAIFALSTITMYKGSIPYNTAMMRIKQLPSAQPEIIYCKDCVKHNRRIGDFKEMPNGEVIWYWKYNACPLAEFRGKAQGHEFDYQFCAYAERREVTE